MKFRILEQRPATAEWVHLVEASSYEEALEMIENGESDILSYDVEVFEDCDFSLLEDEDDEVPPSTEKFTHHKSKED